MKKSNPKHLYVSYYMAQHFLDSLHTPVLDWETEIPGSPRHRRGMNPPLILSHGPNKSMELVFQRLEKGQGDETLSLRYTRCFPSVTQQLAEKRRKARRPEINHSRYTSFSQNMKLHFKYTVWKLQSWQRIWISEGFGGVQN